MRKIDVISDISSMSIDEWGTFVLNHPSGNVFQSPQMFFCYENAIGHTPVVFAAFEFGKMVGVLLADILSEPGRIKGWLTSRAVNCGLHAAFCFFDACFGKIVHIGYC